MAAEEHKLASLLKRFWQRPGVPSRQQLEAVFVWLARTSLPEVMFISTFIFNRYMPNADFSYPYEIIMPIALFAVLITGIYYLYRLVFRRVLTAHIAAMPLAYYLYHYDTLSKIGSTHLPKLLPGNLETPFTTGLLALIGATLFFGAVAFAVVRLASLRPMHLPKPLTQLAKIALFIITFNFLVQAVVLGNLLLQLRPQLTYEHKPITPERSASSKPAIQEKPDIYYLVFDRYAGAETLKDIYNYDNSDLLQFLDTQDFVTRDNAYSNYPFTMSSIGSTLAMDYLPQMGQFAQEDFHTGFPYRSALNNPAVINTLQENGYRYNLVSSWWDFARIGVKADSEPTKSFRLQIFGYTYYQSDLARDIINRTILSPLLKKGMTIGGHTVIKYDLDHDPRTNFSDQMSALRRIARSDIRAPQFTMAHVLVPHDPYVFNADGTATTYSHDRNDEGADEYTKYLNQVKYVNTHIKSLVQDIKKSNPNAVIVLQADEGPYPKQYRGVLSKSHTINPKELPVPQMRQKMSILASYYMPGVDKSAVASGMDSNVNAFRFILSHYMGYDLPGLPDCHISMGAKFDLYSYTLLNKQLKGEDLAKECAKHF